MSQPSLWNDPTKTGPHTPPMNPLPPTNGTGTHHQKKIVSTASGRLTRHTSMEPRSDSIYDQLIDGLKVFFDKRGITRAVIGMSGNVNSALVLKIAIDALGAQNITALIMPETGVTKPEYIDHAKVLCSYLEVEMYIQTINPFITDFMLLPWKLNSEALANAKARIRSMLLYSYANTDQALVLGTSNKSDLLLGYGMQYSGPTCDIQVIGALLKTEVVALADTIGLPPEITGEDDDALELGAPYADVDKVLRNIELGANGCIEKGLPPFLVHKVFRIYEARKHKTKIGPILKI